MAESAISIIETLPEFISEDEHRTRTSSTPNSFADIPPVLRHTQSNVAVKFEPPIQELTGDDLKGGTLYVLESVLTYMSPSGSKGFTVPYPSITLHAISRSDSGPSIYCQIDKSSVENGGEPEPSEDDEVVDLIEMSLIPAEPTSVEAIFEALSLCASLHPDPNFDGDEGDEDAFIDANGGDFEVFDGSNEQELSEVGRAALAHLESIIEYPPGHPRNGAVDTHQLNENEGSTPDQSST